MGNFVKHLSILTLSFFLISCKEGTFSSKDGLEYIEGLGILRNMFKIYGLTLMEVSMLDITVMGKLGKEQNTKKTKHHRKIGEWRIIRTITSLLLKPNIKL